MEDSKGVKIFKQGYNCAQSVMYNYAEILGISIDTALKIATGFGAGMGRKQEVCGAISGGILVISALYGHGENDDKNQKEIVYQKVSELINNFESDFGTIICKKLLDDCILLSEKGRKRFNDEKMINKCYSCVDKVIHILDEIIIQR